MVTTYVDRFWPDGIDLGGTTARDFPKGLDGAQWFLDGNRYRSRSGSPKSLADVVATTMNVLIVRERAAALFGDDLKRPVIVDDEAAAALQLPIADNAIDVARSSGVAAPEGQSLFWTSLEFRPENVQADVFWLREEMPFSYVYMTQEFVDRARNAGVTGLDQIELVWDNGACPLRYPPVREIHEKSGYRYYLEIPFILVRASTYGYMDDEIHPILDAAMASGLLPTRYPT